MRRRLVVAALLVAVALVLLWLGLRARPGEPTASRSAFRPAPGRSVPDTSAPGPLGEPVPGPSPDAVPSAQEGVLALEVLAAERPVPGAEVRLYWRAMRDPSLGEAVWALEGTGLTDARGQLRLAAPPGTYVVAIHTSGHAPRTFHVTRPQGEALTSLRLVLEPGHVLTGRTLVKGRPGEVLPLVQLYLTLIPRDVRPDASIELPPEERVSAVSDARGLFRVDGLPAGAYLLEAEAPGHARAWVYPVQVPAEQPLEVALSAAGVLEGFVVDSRGAAAEGAEVHVNGAFPQSVRTGSGGGFSVEVEAGTYSVSARHGEEAGALEHSVTLGAGRTLGGLRLRLGPGAALEGRVSERASGAPVMGARIEVSPHGENGDLGRESTDETGHFRVSALPPGSYDVVVTRAGFTPQLRRGVTLAPRETFPLDIPLTRLGAVEGWVRDASGQPVAGAFVSAPNVGPEELEPMPRETRSDATGHYQLEGLDVGPQLLMAHRAGSAQSLQALVEVGLEGLARQDFTLRKTGHVEGVVRAVRGVLPTRDVSVFAVPADKSEENVAEVPRALVDAQGDFHLELPAGNYSLVLSGQGDPPAFKETVVRVEEDQTSRVELLWEEPPRSSDERRTVEGTVREPDGTPSPGAIVLLEDSARGRALGTQRTDETGHFSLSVRGGEDPLPSEERLTVHAVNGARGGETSGVRLGERSVTITLRAVASLRGRVSRAQGRMRGFTVHLVPVHERVAQTRGPWHFSGERFELSEVLAEPLRVLVTTEDGAQGEALVTPRPGQATEVDIRVGALASVRGRVVDAATREPVPDLTVTLLDSAEDKQELVGDGRFIVYGLAPGQYRLQLTRPFAGVLEVETRTVKVSEGEELNLGDIPMRQPRPSPP